MSQILVQKSNYILRHTSLFQKINPLTSFLIFLGVALFINIYTLKNFSTHFIGGATHDAGLYIWLIQEAFPSLISKDLNWFSTSAFYPYENTLAWSDNFILPSLIAYPFINAGIKLTYLYNSILLIAITLNGFATFYLARFITNNTICSLFAGLMFMLSPFLNEHAGHPQLQFAFFLPIATYLCLRFFDELSIKHFILLALTIFLSFLTTVYYSVFIIFLTFICLILFLIKNKLKSIDLLCRFDLFATSVVTFIFFLPFIFPYFDVAKQFGERKLYEAYYFSTTILSYVSSSSKNLVYGATANLTHSEAHLFLGLVPIVLIFTYLFIYRRNYFLTCILSLSSIFICNLFIIRPVSLYITSVILWIILIYSLIKFAKEEKSNFSIISFLLITSLIVSFGPLGNPEKEQLPSAPFLIFYYFIPAFKSIRAISRIGILFQLLLSVISGYSLMKLTTELTQRNKVIIYTLCFLLLIIESLPLSYQSGSLPSKPQVFNIIPNDKEPMIVLPLVSVPLKVGEVREWSDFALQNVNAMNWTVGNNHRIVNGYSGIRSKRMKDLPRRLKDFPDERSLEVLSKSLPVKYIVWLKNVDKRSDQEMHDLFEKFQSKGKIKILAEDEHGVLLERR